MSSKRLIEAINSKVDRLIAQNQKLLERAELLDGQKERLKTENAGLKEKIGELEKRISILEIVDTMSEGDENRKSAKARINTLIREIDSCIGLLNK